MANIGYNHEWVFIKSCVGYMHVNQCIYGSFCVKAIRVSRFRLLLDVNVYICLLTHRQGTRKEDKLMTSQNKTGPENLPLKAVIALMGAAATLSRLAKDPRTSFISPFLSEQLKGGA